MENKNEFLSSKKYFNVHQKIILSLLNTCFPNDISNLVNDYTYYLEGVVDFTFVVKSEMTSCLAPLPDGRVAIGSCIDQFMKFSGNTILNPNEITLEVLDINSDNTPYIYFKESSNIKCMTILSDERIVCGTCDGIIKVWNINCEDTCELVLIKHNDCVECLKIIPKTDNTDEKIVSGSKDNTLKIWNAKDGFNEFTLIGHTDSVVCLEILSNRRIVSGSCDSTIKIWNPDNGNCESTLIGHTRNITCIAILTNDVIVSGSDDTTLKLWNSKKDSSIIHCYDTLIGHTDSVSCIAISHTKNQKIVSGSKDSTLKIWNLDKNNRVETVLSLRGHIKSVTCIIINNDLIFSGSLDGSIKKWNLTNGRHSGTNCTRTKFINCLTSLPDRTIISGGSGKSILNVFREAEFSESPCYSVENMNHVKKLCLLSSGRILGKLAYDEVVIYKLFDDDCKIRTEFSINGLYVNTLNDERIVSTTDDNNGTLKIWNPHTNNCDLTLKNNFGQMQKKLVCSAILSDGRLVTCFKVGFVTIMNIWNIFSGKCEVSLNGHTACVTCIVVLPQNIEKIVSGSEDNTIKIFDPVTGKNESTLIGHTMAIRHLGVLNNDGRLVSSDDETIRVWNINNNTCDKIISVGGFINYFKILPNSQIIYTCDSQSSDSHDPRIKILNPNMGKCECVLIGHTDTVTCITVRSDGYIVSGSMDKTVKIWNSINGRCEATLIGHTDKVTDIVAYPDGRIISCSRDKTIKIWK